MKVFVKAKPRAKQEKLEKIDSSHYIVSVKEPPLKGQANKAIIKVLADYFNIPKSQIKIISGLSSKQKTIEINS